MKKELLALKRKKAKELHKKDWSNRKIARYLLASKNSVGKWVLMDDSEISVDNRGWKKGKPRKYTPETKQQIIKIRKELKREDSYFIGSNVVMKNYENQTGEKVSKSFVDGVLKEAGLVKSPRSKKKGRSRYMKYPEYTINRLGKSMMSIDFIGPKYLKGSNNRINFLSCKYIRPEKLGIAKRIKGQTTEQTIKTLKEIWETHPIPEILKIDNDAAFGANLSQKKYIGKLVFFLLNLGVTPLYVAPRSPWNNGHVEGFNSVFSKKFWNKLQFSDEQEIDIKITDFNVAYEKYSQLISNNPEIEEKDIRYIGDFKNVDLENKYVKNFMTDKIYFLRIVRRKNAKGSDEEYGSIDILKHEIKLPKDLINLFVFCVLDLKSKNLKINIELDDRSLKEIKSMAFTIKNVIYD
jgi:predicted transcriptional regulator